MIESFYVKNFRLFDEVKISNMKRVNLIAGKNNSGKTALLEALYIYLTKSSQKSLFDLLVKREENWGGKGNELEAAHIFKHLFFNHHLPEVTEQGIILGQLTPSGKVSKKDCIEIKTLFEVTEYDANDKLSISYTEKKVSQDDDVSLVLLSREGKKVLQKIRLENDFFRSSRMSERYDLVIKSKKNIREVHFVTTDFAENQRVSRLWDEINLTDLVTEVIEGLKIIEPRIEGVAFVEGELRKGRIPLIKLKGVDERLSLKSLGDGVFRVFHMILSLVNAKGGYLFIDEFENGLHWSVQEKIWNVIFKLSDKLDIQVFATSHSRDCINSFEKVWKEHSSKGSFCRLDYDGNKHHATTYDLDTLSDSMEMDVEVR